MGFDIQHYYALHQSLTLEDLAKASSKHTLKGLVKVINKVSAFFNHWLSSLLLFNQGTFESPSQCSSPMFSRKKLQGMPL